MKHVKLFESFNEEDVISMLLVKAHENQTKRNIFGTRTNPIFLVGNPRTSGTKIVAKAADLLGGELVKMDLQSIAPSDFGNGIPTEGSGILLISGMDEAYKRAGRPIIQKVLIMIKSRKFETSPGRMSKLGDGYSIVVETEDIAQVAGQYPLFELVNMDLSRFDTRSGVPQSIESRITGGSGILLLSEMYGASRDIIQMVVDLIKDRKLYGPKDWQTFSWEVKTRTFKLGDGWSIAVKLKDSYSSPSSRSWAEDE